MSDGSRSRYQLLDILRGLAILAMIVFHIAWDLFYFGYSRTDVTSELGWVIFQKVILSSFLLLVGASLVLGHSDGIRWDRFWRRWGFIVAGALATTAGTYWMFPDYFVFFGVLHAIALFSLLGLAFLRLPAWLVAVIGGAVIAANLAYNDPMFTSRELGWIGFWPTSPPTSDVVPIFPWFGAVLLGIAAMRLVLASPLKARLATLRSEEPLAKGLAFIGRWSLLIYLLHQPLIIGIFMGLAQLQAPVIAPPVPPPTVETPSEKFARTCQQSCLATGGTAEHCAAYCQCALDQVEAGDLWPAVGATDPTAEQLAQVYQVTKLCTAMVDTAPAP